MQAVFNHLEFHLGARDAFAIDRAAAAAITVLCGSIWVTQDGKLADHVLKAGQTLKVSGDAAILVSALTPAQVSVDAPARRPAVEARARGAWRMLFRKIGAAYLRGFRGVAARAAKRRFAGRPTIV